MRRASTRSILALLHPVFALTGILHAIAGPLLPSFVAAFHLDDRQSGLIFLLYFAGTTLGALLCRSSYARVIAIGFAFAAVTCVWVASATWPLFPLAFFLLGIGVGVPMTGVSLFVGRSFPQTCAPLLTFLNFTWSVGALLAPLLAARILRNHSYRAAYAILAITAGLAAISCVLWLRDSPEAAPASSAGSSIASLRLIPIFAFAAFLEVGVENTAAAWLATFAMRTGRQGIVSAAASTSLYWAGFLAARGLVSLLLLRTRPALVFRCSAALAVISGATLALAPSPGLRGVTMFCLGVGLAPIFPLLLSDFFSRAQHTSHSRWVLASAGFGGAILPWLAGWLSSATGTIRAGIFVIPAAMLLMLLMLAAARPVARLHSRTD